MELFEDHDNGGERLLHGKMILLQLRQFMRSKHKRSFLLDDNSTHLVVRNICIMWNSIMVGV